MDFIKTYNKELTTITNSIAQNLGSEANNRYMLNGNGSADVDYCVQRIPVDILLIHPPTEGEIVLVDIGSGWGACAKQFALLGYKVYSIDIDQRHLDFQKNDFCRMPPVDTFVYQYW